MPPAPVAIIGGGPAGSAAALELRGRGLPVILFERSNYEEFRIGESVPPTARQIIFDLGMSEDVLFQDSLPSQGVWSSWGSAGLFEKSFVFSPYGIAVYNQPAADESLGEYSRQYGQEIKHARNPGLETWRLVQNPLRHKSSAHIVSPSARSESSMHANQIGP